MAATFGVGIVKPNNLATQGVDTNLLRTAWANDIYLESLQVEPLFNSNALTEVIKVGNDNVMLPSKVFMNVTPAGENGKAARDIVLSFTKSLSGTGRFGNSERLLGNEEQIALKFAKFFANDWAHAVSTETFGIDYREVSPYKIYEKARPLLAQWFGELNGLFARQAFNETRSENLTKSPISLTQPLNPNWYVPGVSTASQPTYDSTAATFENNVGDVLATATAANAHFTVPELLQLADYAQDNYVKQFNSNGFSGYILYVASDEYRRLIDPATTNSWASFWKDAAAIQDIDKVIPGAVGMIGESIIVARDRRASTLTLGGTSADRTFTFGYLRPGRNDGRATGRTDNTHFNMNVLMGENCLAKYEPEAPHYEEQVDEYGRYQGVGYIGACAWQIPIWDVDTPTDTSAQQESSIVVPTQR